MHRILKTTILKAALGLLTSCTTGVAVREAPASSAADGQGSFAARPVAVVSEAKEIIRIESKSGDTVDRRSMKKRGEVVSKDPLPGLTRRLRAAENPSVLFVGNSYSFDVPAAFRDLAAAEGRPVRVEQVTHGGWTLEKHAANPETLDKIRNDRWDAVVIQEQSQMASLSAGRRDAAMLPAAGKLVALIRESGAVPVLYQTWARRDGDRQNAAAFPDDTFAAMDKRLSAGFASLRRSIPELAAVRAGDAWADLHGRGEGVGLYKADGSHPSGDGIQLTAAVFYATLFDAPVTAPGGAGRFRETAGRIGRRQPPELP